MNNSQLIFSLIPLVFSPVEVSVSKRAVTVKGKRGTLKREFQHVQVDMYKVGKQRVRVEKWFGVRKQLAAVRTVCTHIENMIKGVTLVSFSSSLIFALHFQVSWCCLGLSLQNAIRLCPFPHQLSHQPRQHCRGNPKLFGRKDYPNGEDGARSDVHQLTRPERRADTGRHRLGVGLTVRYERTVTSSLRGSSID
jgi:Ribosomal protein L6